MKYLQYYLMHKDVVVALIILDANGSLQKFDISNENHVPIGCRDIKTFSGWWERRAIPSHQQNQNVLLNGISNKEYMVVNLGLSLVDCYWIKPINSDLKWREVNLYENNFEETDFHYSDLTNVSPFKPSATTQGELQKRWVIINNDRYLVKGNYGDMCRQSLNEVFASDVHTMQCMPHVSYDRIELPTTMGNGIGCISKNFTSPSLEFIPSYDITLYRKQNNTESVYQQYVSVCCDMGIERETMQKFMDYMILSDFLFTNVDRHLLNFGILRDPDTLNFVKPAPLFDTGNSMFYNRKYNPNTILDIPITSFYKTEWKMLEKVCDRATLNLDAVPDATELDKWYECDPYSAIYLENVKQGYAKKIELLRSFQRGCSLNPRSSKFKTEPQPMKI